MGFNSGFKGLNWEQRLVAVIKVNMCVGRHVKCQFFPDFKKIGTSLQILINASILSGARHIF